MVEIVQNLANLIKVVVCATSVIYTFLVVIDLTYFLSVPKITKNVVISKDLWLKTSWSLFVNMGLLTVFILQHSCLAAQEVQIRLKGVLRKCRLESLYRCIYIVTTSFALQLLLNNWISIPEITLWKLYYTYRPLWWPYCAMHFIFWIITYVGFLCTDITELLGIKQVKYSFQSFPRDPSQMKSDDLLRLYSHKRHPSFLSFTLIFWMAPVMSLDRLLLAVILTLYMVFTWNPDNRDYVYQKLQYNRKYHELERLNRHQ